MNGQPDRLVSRTELKQLCAYSAVHLDRMERDGRFPKRIQIGPGRVAWSFLELQQWIGDRKAARDGGTDG